MPDTVGQFPCIILFNLHKKPMTLSLFSDEGTQMLESPNLTIPKSGPGLQGKCL